MEFTWESGHIVCLTKAEGGKEAKVEKRRGEHAGGKREIKRKGDMGQVESEIRKNKGK